MFRNTATSGTISSSSLATREDYAVGRGPISVAAGDLDGDSKPDIIALNASENTLSIFRNYALPPVAAISASATNICVGGTSTCTNATSGGFWVSSNTAIATVSSSGTVTGVSRGLATISYGVVVGYDTNFAAKVIVVQPYAGVITNSGPVVVGAALTLVDTVSSGTWSSASPSIATVNGSGVVTGMAAGLDTIKYTITNSCGTAYAAAAVWVNGLPLSISSVSPSAAVAGTSITIAGTNFNTTAANNIVRFGATRANVTSASSTSITATLPYGSTYKPVSILDSTTNQAGYAPAPFMPKFSTAGYIPDVLNFAIGNFTGVGSPSEVAVGDLDGDGKPDLVSVNGGNYTISIFRNTGTSGSVTSSSLASRVDMSVGTTPTSVAIEDMDGDGKLDIVVANYGSGSVSVFRNIGAAGSITTASFATRVDFTTGNGPYNVALADLDKDGKPDIITANYTDNTISVLRNTCTPGTMNTFSFAAKVDFAAATNVRAVAVADIDGDGKKDVFTADYGTNTISVYRNTSTPGALTASSLASRVAFTAATRPQNIAAGDIDGDGKLDIVAANYGSSSLSVFRNTATSGVINTSSLAAKVDLSVYTSAYGLAICDIDGDGKADILSGLSGYVHIFRDTSTVGGISASSFAPRVDIAAYSGTAGIIACDMDGDGITDIAGVNTFLNTISIFRSQFLKTPPAISSVSPNTGNVGASVTITGTNFNTTAANDVVYFGATKAAVSAASATSLTVSVPSGASYKPVSVMNSATGLAANGQYAFMPVFNNSAYISGVINFTSRVDIASTSGPSNAVIADIDGDGKPDMLVTVGTKLSVYRNIGSSGSIATGSFGSSVDFTLPAGGNTNGIVVNDLDGDGKPDVSVASGTNICLFQNLSSAGSFTTSSLGGRVDIAVSVNLVGLTAVDIDGDGKPELAGGYSSSLYVYHNTATQGTLGSSSFGPGVNYATGSNSSNTAVGDIDGDGKPDFVVCNSSSASISVLRNTATFGSISSTSFATRVDFTTGTSPSCVVIADLDGDGKADIAVSNYGSSTLSLFRNTASSGTITTGSLASKVDFTTGTNPRSVAVGDLDGDGKLDLAVINYISSTVSVFCNTGSSGSIGTSSLASKVDFTSGIQPYQLAIGDIDGDGRPDMAVGNLNTSATSVFWNNPLYPIAGPGTVCSGSNVTLTDNAAGGTWSSSATGIATVSTTGVVTGVTAGTAIITYAVIGGYDTAIITVNTTPVISVAAVSSTYCNGSNTNITASGASTYTWSPATALSATTGATVNCTATTTTTYTVTGTSAAGCVGTANQVITVNPIPVLTVTPVSSTYCNGSNTNITASGASTYTWSAATALSATTGATVNCSATTTTSYTVTGTSAAGCVGTANQTITVNPIPVLTVTPVSSTYCNGSNTNITASGASTYTWSPATALSATTGATVNCTATTTTTYTVTGTSGAGCVGTATRIITVNPIPVLTVTPASSTYCNGSNTNITASGASTYTWSPATALSATTGATVNCTATTTTTYTATGTSGAGCVGTANQVITVNPIPVLTVTPVSSTYCNGSNTNITASGATTYTWSPATALSATTGATVNCTATTTTTYTVTGTSAAGCVGTANQTITVNPIPVLTVTPVSSTYCNGSNTNITASGASTYTWSPATALSATTGATVNCTATTTTTYTVTGTSAAGCVGTANQVITVNPIPVLTVTPVSSTYCNGSNTNITASGASTYTWSPATALSATTGATVNCTATTTTTYTVTGTSAAGCVGTANRVITVNPIPVLTVTPVSSSYCNGSNTNIAASGASTYTWSPATALSATTGATVNCTATTTTTYTVTGTNAAGCIGTATRTITVNQLPVVGAIGGSSLICLGASTTLVDTSVVGTWSSSNSAVATTSGALVTGRSVGTSTISYAVTNGCGTTTVTFPITINAMQWVGGASGHETDWNTASNWACGSVPGVSDDALIATGSAYMPVLTAASSGYARNISIASGAVLTLNAGATFNIKGHLTNNGAVTGAGTLAMNGTSSQNITGNGSVKNFTLSNSTGAIITSGSLLIVKNLLTLSSGTLITNDSLVLYADSAATARVAPIASGAAISGNVKVMQYIQGGLRRYRFWSHPFSNYIGLSQLQNYIDVTGPGGAGNGFTNTASNAPSAYRYNPLVGNDSLPSDPGWKPYTNAGTSADSNRLHRYQGIRVFFRGAKGQGLGYGAYTPAPTVVAQWGVLNQGTQSVTMAKGSGTHQDYNMIGNPYASPVDIGTVVYNAKIAGNVAGSAFYIWNPTLGAAGQFQAMAINTSTPVPYYIPANCAFQVRTTTNGNTLTFNENNKGASSTSPLLRSGNTFASLVIYDAQYHPWDILQLGFDDAADEKEGDEDAAKPAGGGLSFYSLSANKKALAIDVRPFSAEKPIQLGLRSEYAQEFTIKVGGMVSNAGKALYLHDKLLEQYVLLEDGAAYKFSITDDTKTQGNGRFEITANRGVTPARGYNGLTATISPNPATGNVCVSYVADVADETTIRVLDLSGKILSVKEVGSNEKGNATISLSKLPSGMYMIEVKSGSNKTSLAVIKE